VPDGAKERPLKQKTLTDSTARHLKVTEDLARGFYSAGIAGNVSSNKLLQRGLLSVAEAGGAWRPPSRKELLGTLLDREHARVQTGIAEARSTNARVGVVLVGDGAVNVSREPFLNVLSVQGNRREFIKAQNCAGKVKDMRFIADDIIGVINSLEDPQSVVAVMMDNATRGAWPLIEAACPWVVACACGPHVADLLQEDVGKLPFFKAYGGEAKLARSAPESSVEAIRLREHARARQAARSAGMVAGGACARRCAPEQPASVPKAMWNNASSHCCSMTPQQPARRARGLQRTLPAPSLRCGCPAVRGACRFRRRGRAAARLRTSSA
jgi:hypothetical protein